jgi:hypothetical protein
MEFDERAKIAIGSARRTARRIRLEDNPVFLRATKDTCRTTYGDADFAFGNRTGAQLRGGSGGGKPGDFIHKLGAVQKELNEMSVWLKILSTTIAEKRENIIAILQENLELARIAGRAYSPYTAEELYFQFLNKKPLKLEPLKPNYNMSPTHTTPILRLMDGGRDVDTMTWGLIPEWSPEFKTKFSTINARSEGVFESRLYKKPILSRRCIIPVSGFFKWKKEGSAKRPFKISLKDSPIMSLAGIWTSWRDYRV